MHQNIPIRFLAVVALFILMKVTGSSAASDTGTAFNGITIGYYRSALITNIGGELGVERYWFHNQKRTVVGNVSLLVVRKPGMAKSVGIIVGDGLRRTYKPGLYFEQGVKCGYLGSYYDFDTYKTDSRGDIVNIGRTWTSSVIGGYYLGLGYDFDKLTKINLQLFVKPFFYLRYPNLSNAYFMHNYSIEAGISVHPKWSKRQAKKQPDARR